MPIRRQEILTVLRDRLETIAIAAGYQTDAGENVFLGELPALGEDDPDVALAIVVGDEVPQYQGEQLFVRLPFELHTIAKADLDEPWLTVEQLIADVKRAIEQPDRTLGGLVRRMIEREAVRTVPREPGSTTVGAMVVYVAPYLEAWGDP